MLRLLVVLEADTALAPLLARLMDHNEERQAEQPAVWQFEQEFIVDFIHQVLSNFSDTSTNVEKNTKPAEAEAVREVPRDVHQARGGDPGHQLHLAAAGARLRQGKRPLPCLQPHEPLLLVK